jgi:diacylglycerol kinase family enzyme
MRVLLLVNASASAVTARARVVIQKALSADHELKVAETSRRGHATRLAQGAAASGADVVVVLGGDGTLNEAANGLAGSTTALGVLPGGSTNVFARTIGMHNDPIEATGQLVDALAAGTRRRIGIGSANGRYFLFHVGLGFDAAVVEQVEKRGALKRYAGHPLFVWAAVVTWARHYDRTRPRFAVRFDDGTLIDDGYFGICLKTSPYTYLGNRPIMVGREATLDSRLVMVTFRSLKLRTLVGATASAMGSGRRLRRDRHIHQRADVEAVTVTGHGPFPFQLDGDYLGEVEKLELRYEPDCLELIVPTA